jgi:type IV fimbrial biogenesis protein FimT
MKRQDGFTLIELMTTLGIAAILVSMAVPGMQSVAMNSKQRSGVNEIVAAMHLARNTAITTNSRVTFCTSSDGNSCGSNGWNEGWIVFTDLNSNQSVDNGESVVRAGGANEGLFIKSSQFSRFLMYRPNGRVMNATTAGNNGSFVVCDKRGSGHAKVVNIDLAGRPSASEHTSSGTSPSCG